MVEILVAEKEVAGARVKEGFGAEQGEAAMAEGVAAAAGGVVVG
jgi:hypothetical protein